MRSNITAIFHVFATPFIFYPNSVPIRTIGLCKFYGTRFAITHSDEGQRNNEAEFGFRLQGSESPGEAVRRASIRGSWTLGELTVSSGGRVFTVPTFNLFEG